MPNLKWLPAKISPSDFSNFNEYINHLYLIFTKYFFDVNNKIKYDNRNVEISPLMLSERCLILTEKGLTCRNSFTCSNCPFVDKEDIFNHITCKRLNDETRTPGKYEEERAIRLPWIKPIIENCNEAHPSIKYYEKILDGELRKYFWLDSEKYIVVLTEGKDNKLYLTTAYYLYNRKCSDRYRKEYKEYCRKLKKTL